MTRLFRLSGAVRRDPAVEAWFAAPGVDLKGLAATWFERMRDCGADVHELIHDGCPTACVGDVAFAYVGVFKAHINVGFFHGATLADPAGLLEGSGKYMRHTKLRWGEAVDDRALGQLIASAYADARALVAAAGAGPGEIV
ncbi:DUF1801 domain-containing protein [Brevundimonas sp. R86498]|uniref:DUF1801 domain-containing protein n=1 Tax=Brevundimonas sp. R86498 TaxID=3093845 RepID=UPI0037C532A2